MAKTTMDVGALRKFQEVWGPVIDAIPAVINMAESFADVERGLAQKRKELEDVVGKVDSAMDEGNARYAKLLSEIETATATLADTQARIRDVKHEVAAATKAAQDVAAAEVAKAEADTKAEVASIRAKVKEATSELEAVRADKAAVVAEAQAKLDEIEKRVVAAEKSLAALRAKLV